MFIVAVNLVCDPDQLEPFKARLIQHSKNSLTQEGCLGFSVSQDHENPASFHLWEAYTDKYAFQLHVDADFMAEFREFSAPLVKERVIATGEQVA